VDRLYTTGWLPDGDEPLPPADLDRLPSGLRFPTVEAVRKAFALVGLELTVRSHLMFACHRATWRPTAPGDDRFGTVVGKCDREAAVYALAMLQAAGLHHHAGAVGR
jgi:hypothetical protein